MVYSVGLFPYLCCGNSGTEAAPKWGKLGKRVEDSSLGVEVDAEQVLVAQGGGVLVHYGVVPDLVLVL